MPLMSAEDRYAASRNGDVFVFGDDRSRVLVPAARLAEVAPAVHWHRQDAPQAVPPAEHVHRTESLHVEVNGGRWIVRCPCGGAQMASRRDRRFFCVDCLNEWAGGRWLIVTWPSADQERAIEQLLSQRPDEHTRSWTPGETPRHLEVENQTHGVRA